MIKNIVKILPFLLLLGCKKIEEVPGNSAPVDPTVSNTLKENYVNKIYISVLERKPDSLEFRKAIQLLNQHNASAADRKQFLDSLFKDQGYNKVTYQIVKNNLLNNLDTASITKQINTFKTQLNPSNQLQIDRLLALQQVPADLSSGVITMTEVCKRCVNNYFYDQINMGTNNFATSIFQNLLLRFPSSSELSNASNMINGSYALLFFQWGESKDDFLNIFFSSTDYFEGQVTDLYIRYLYRKPNSEEMASLGAAYKSNLDYMALQKTILSSNEYLGI